MTQITITQQGRAQHITVHDHDMRYIHSKAVEGGRKAVYKCLSCPLTKIGEHVYVR